MVHSIVNIPSGIFYIRELSDYRENAPHIVIALVVVCLSCYQTLISIYVTMILNGSKGLEIYVYARDLTVQPILYCSMVGPTVWKYLP